GRGQRIHGQCDPGTHESFGRAIPGPGGATTGQDNADAEQESANDDGQRCKTIIFRCNDPTGGQGGQPDGVDRNDHQQGDKGAPRTLQENIADHAGDTKTPALHDSAEDGTDEQTSKNHRISAFKGVRKSVTETPTPESLGP